jgi:hypothetical protein
MCSSFTLKIKTWYCLKKKTSSSATKFGHQVLRRYAVRLEPGHAVDKDVGVALGATERVRLALVRVRLHRHAAAAQSRGPQPTLPIYLLTR